MKKNNLAYTFKSVPIKNIDRDDKLTDFSLSAPSDSLLKSIEEIGVIHPVILTPIDNRFRIVCGHRRVKISSQLQINEIPARILDLAPNDESMLMLNLSENQFHHHYTDIEKGVILFKLSEANVTEIRIIEKYMPMLGLEKSKKLLEDHLSTNKFVSSLRILLHEMKVPLRVFSVFFNWDKESILAAEQFFSVLRPGVNKWRDLLELIEEISTRDEISPVTLFELAELKSVLNQNDLAPNVRYERIRQTLHFKRFPILNDLRVRLAKTLDELKLDDKTRVHIQDNFESDEIRVEMKFRTREEFVSQVEKLVRASDSTALDKLINIFKNP